MRRRTSTLSVCLPLSATFFFLFFSVLLLLFQGLPSSHDMESTLRDYNKIFYSEFFLLCLTMDYCAGKDVQTLAGCSSFHHGEQFIHCCGSLHLSGQNTLWWYTIWRWRYKVPTNLQLLRIFRYTKDGKRGLSNANLFTDRSLTRVYTDPSQEPHIWVYT